MLSIREETFFDLLSKVTFHFTRLTVAGDVRPELFEAEVAAILAVIGMEDFKAHGGRDRLTAIIRCIMRHFADEPVRLVLAGLRSPESGRTSVTAMGVVQEGESAGEALSRANKLISAFQTLVKNLSSSSLPIFMDVFFGIAATEDGAVEPVGYAFTLLVRNIPAQFLCIFLSEIFRQLERANTEAALYLLVDTLTELLLSNRGPLGYSAVEIANNLLRLLRKQRPSAPTDTRVSILHQGGPPSKAVFTICNCLVSVLRNTNFASQKYEIINHIIHKAFLPKEQPKATTTALTVDRPTAYIADHHSLATVSLDNAEETQFRAVIWSVLFAMAEESLPPTILKLAFVEIPVKLFESLLLMILNPDSEFRLSSLALLHRLLLNGLSFTGHFARRDPALRPLFSTQLPKVHVHLVKRLPHFRPG